GGADYNGEAVCGAWRGRGKASQSKSAIGADVDAVELGAPR
ncbi:MAG: hypothetical protein RLZZ568_1193, partial [Cyanobacteriota bacterium]